MKPKIYAASEGKAVYMQKSADQLAAMLLQVIVCSEIYEAVLDDASNVATVTVREDVCSGYMKMT